MRIIQIAPTMDVTARIKYWVVCDEHKVYFDFDVPEKFDALPFVGDVRVSIEELGRKQLNSRCLGCIEAADAIGDR